MLMMMLRLLMLLAAPAVSSAEPAAHTTHITTHQAVSVSGTAVQQSIQQQLR
jgi:outer membrane protein assembly factor BamE (lipoprotein component of BamABCDE complex)